MKKALIMKEQIGIRFRFSMKRRRPFHLFALSVFLF